MSERERIVDDTIELLWDEKAGVWVATFDEIPGLVLEDESKDDLMERVRVAAQELRDLNKKQKDNQ